MPAIIDKRVGAWRSCRSGPEIVIRVCLDGSWDAGSMKTAIGAGIMAVQTDVVVAGGKQSLS